jgi:iron complex transport system substrate-binding protein
MTAAVLLLALLMTPAAPAIAQDEPQRVITLGGDITEIVYQLGAGDRLVARDSTSTYPPEAEALPDVGYFRQLGAEGVISLRPDLILASASAGPPEVLQQIAETGIRIEHLPDSHSADGLLDKVRQIAQALKMPEAGAALAMKLGKDLEESQAKITAMDDAPKVLFIINTGSGALMAAGRETSADALIKLAGAENVFASHDGYKTISLESAAASAPDAIALMAHTLKALGGPAKVADHPALKLTPAAKEKRIVARDGSYLLSFGPRLPEVIVDFAEALRGKGKS